MELKYAITYTLKYGINNSCNHTNRYRFYFIGYFIIDIPFLDCLSLLYLELNKLQDRIALSKVHFPFFAQNKYYRQNVSRDRKWYFIDFCDILNSLLHFFTRNWDILFVNQRLDSPLGCILSLIINHYSARELHSIFALSFVVMSLSSKRSKNKFNSEFK